MVRESNYSTFIDPLKQNTYLSARLGTHLTLQKLFVGLNK